MKIKLVRAECNRAGSQLKGRTGQMFSIDVFAATAAFIFVLIASLFLWNQTTAHIELQEQRSLLSQTGRDLMAVLVETPGMPANWSNLTVFDETTMTSVGLARSSSINGKDIRHAGTSASINNASYLLLDVAKVRLLASNLSNYTTMKKLLGIRGLDIYGEVRRWDGTQYVEQFSFGIPVAPTSADTRRWDRFALMNQTWTHVMIKVWRECRHAPC